MKRDREIGFWQHFTTVLLVALGLAIVALGTQYKSQIVIALGGAFVGASLGHWLSALLAAGPARDLKQLLGELRARPLASLEPSNEFLVSRWHFYAPRIQDSEERWIHTVLNCPTCVSRHSLAGVFTRRNPQGERKQHFIEVERRDNRLLIYVKPVEANESIAVYVFPIFFSGLEAGIHVGISFVQTYDGDETIIPAVLSSSHFVATKQEGEVTADEGQALRSEWGERFTRFLVHVQSSNPASQ